VTIYIANQVKFMFSVLLWQAPPTCNVLADKFVPHILPGHKIGQVNI